MKKIFGIILIGFVLLAGCKNDNEKLQEIPSKLSATDTSSPTSPINSRNLDSYMFREDVQYIDLRSSRMVLEEGYV